MESTIVWRQIQKFNNSLRWHNLIGLALLIGLGAWQYRYLRNCFLGPQKIDSAELLKITDPDRLDRNFVTYTSEKALDTGFQRVSKSRRSGTETLGHRYLVAVVGGEKALLVEAQSIDDLKNPTFTGGLSTISDDVQTKVVDPLLKEAPSMKSRMLPMVLGTNDYRLGSYMLVPLLLGGIGFCSWNVYQAGRRAKDPRKHPVYKTLARYGEADLMATDLDRELRTHYNIDDLKTNNTYITPNWLVHPQTYGLQVVQFDRLMWVYKKVTSHSVNFIPTGKSYELLMHDNFGKEYTLKMSEQEVHATIEQINGHAPWAVVGFSDEIKALWYKQRDEFYQIVAERKKETNN
jgi:hypothetical protein